MLSEKAILALFDIRDNILAARRFTEALPVLSELAELQTAVLRLSRELRKTQRRCNSLSKIVIPNCRETIGYVAGTLEERERESFAILRMIRDRLSRQDERQGPAKEAEG